MLQGVRQRNDNMRNKMCDNMCNHRHLHRQQSHHIWDYPYDQRPVAFFFSAFGVINSCWLSPVRFVTLSLRARVCAPTRNRMTLNIVYNYYVGAKM